MIEKTITALRALNQILNYVHQEDMQEANRLKNIVQSHIELMKKELYMASICHCGCLGTSLIEWDTLLK